MANRSAERAGNSDRPSLVAPDGHVALAGDDERGAAAGGASGRSLRIVRIEHWPGVGGMAAAREAKMLTHGLADDLPTGIEDAGHNGRVHVGDVALQHVGAVHHRDAGHAHVVLDGDFLARERSRRCAFDRAPPVPGVEPIVRGGWTEPRLARVLHRQCRLRELVQATVRREHTVHEVAERRQIVAAEIQVVGFGDARQFRQRWLAQNAGRRRRRGWRLDGRLGGRTNGRCRGDDGCRYPGRAGVKETTTRIVWR